MANSQKPSSDDDAAPDIPKADRVGPDDLIEDEPKQIHNEHENEHNNDPKKTYDDGVVEVTAATTPHGRALEIDELIDPLSSPETERLTDRPEE